MKKGGRPGTRRLLQSLETLAGRDVAIVAIVGSGTANAAARTRRLLLCLNFRRMNRLPIVVSADRWRQDRKIDPLVIIVSPRLPTATAIVIVADTPVGPVTARLSPLAVTPVARRPVAARLGAIVGRTRAALLRPALRLFFVVALDIDFANAIIVAVGFHPVVTVIVLVVVVSLALLFVESRSGIAEHAKIMIRELQVIFSLDAVAGQLGVAGHALVFFEQLGGIAALAIILTIAATVAGHAAGLLSTAAATAAALTIIDQTKFPRRTGAMAPQNHSLEGQSFNPTAVLRAYRAGAPFLVVCA